MDNHASAQQIARQSGSNFYLSFFSLPRPQREALTAVYAFCRQVDDAVDLPTEQASAPGAAHPEQEVARWRQEVEDTFAGRPTLPSTRALLPAIERFHLTKAYFNGILDGVAMDLQARRYRTFDALYQYCYHVASEVGLLCMEIFGYRSERLNAYAIQLGLAFQLTNILRDVKPDAERGRIYLPQEDLEKFGVSEKDILSARYSPAFARLMAFEAERARGYYEAAARLPAPEERPALRAAEIMAAVYRDVLQRIEKRNYNVFGERVHVPTPVKFWLVLKTWWSCR